MLPFNKNLKTLARELRKNIGDYIVDFYCPSAKLIVELDGGQHYTEEGKRRDQVKDKYLESLGIIVLRFSDREVFKNIEGVLERIFEHL